MKGYDDAEAEQISLPMFGANLASDTLDQRKKRALAIFKVKCMQDTCRFEYEFPGLFHKDKKDLCGMICPRCNEALPEAYVKNRVGLFLKEVVKYYY